MMEEEFKEQLNFRSQKVITSGKGGSDEMGKIILSAGRIAQTQISLGDDLKKDECLFSILCCFFFLNPNKIFFFPHSLSKVLICFIFHHLMKHQNCNSGIKIHLQGCDHLSYLC